MDALRKFSDLVIKYDKQSQDLLTILVQERRALTANESQALLQVTESKQNLLAAAQKTDTEIAQILSKIQAQTGKQGLEGLWSMVKAQQPSQQQQLAEQWQRLQGKIQECQEVNRINGMIIGARMNTIQRSLDIICHGKPSATVQYDAKGSIVTSSG